MQKLIDKYGKLGMVKIPGTEKEVPILNLPMMSDEEWQQLAAKQRDKTGK
ncbi:MAG: hypothetical protein IKU67_04105 [Firmicutes bacterium]|nr:hypothetical protein [Bacillota bacterium]